MWGHFILSNKVYNVNISTESIPIRLPVSASKTSASPIGDFDIKKERLITSIKK